MALRSVAKRVFSGGGKRCFCLVVGGALLVSAQVGAQVLARPGWAGSGIKIARWWRNAVLIEITPPAAGTQGPSRLKLLAGQLDDLQTLGSDAIVLRGLSAAPGAPAVAGSRAAGTASPLNPAYGSLDELDELLRETSRRRQRLVAEVPAGVPVEVATGIARFWLSRGFSGLYLPGDNAAERHAVRAAMRGYAGERVLVGDAAAMGGPDAPELAFSTLNGLGGGSAQDLATLRGALEGMRKGRGSEVVAEVDPSAPPVTGAAAEARAAVLAAAPGGLALRLDEVGMGPEAQAQVAAIEQDKKDAAELARATSPAGRSNVQRAIARRKAGAQPTYDGDAVFQWTARMIGLHRGNGAMLEGQQVLLNEDEAGVLAVLWKGRNGVVLTELVNLRGTPASFSLKEPFAAQHLRGAFLRPMARTDGGMGAVGLDGAKLPGFGVFFGELGR